MKFYTRSCFRVLSVFAAFVELFGNSGADNIAIHADSVQNQVYETYDAKDIRKFATLFDSYQDSKISEKRAKKKKRAIDFCKDLVARENSGPCSQPYKEGLFCDEGACPSKPSYPYNIKVDQELDSDESSIDLRISWSRPEFGRNNLCGFQIFISRLSRALGSYCILLNNKTQLSYIHHGGIFDTTYNITVVSLPSYKDLDRSSRFLEIKTDSKCQMLKKSNLPMPWECSIPSVLSTSACINRSVNITLEPISNASYDSFFVMVAVGNRFSSAVVFHKNYGKWKKNATVNHGLQPGLKYVAMVFYQNNKINRNGPVVSKPFICQGEMTRIEVSQCQKKNVTVKWNKVKLENIRYKISLYSIGPRGGKDRIRKKYEHEISTNMSGLRKNTWYVIKVEAILLTGLPVGEATSEKFICGARPTGLTSDPETYVSVIISLVVVVLLGILAGFMVFMIRKRSSFYTRVCRLRDPPPILLNRHDVNQPNDVIPAAEIDPQTNKVLILYPNGCKCMEKIVVLLAKALGQLGCTVLLDLYNTLEAAELGGREMYNTKKMSEAGRVLVVFSEETNQQAWNIFRGHVQAILKKIVENEDKSSKYIPVSIGDVSEQEAWRSIVERTDPIKQVENASRLSKLLLRCVDTEVLEENDGHPTLNIPAIEKTLSDGLQIWMRNLTRAEHLQCSQCECSKGIEDSFQDLKNGSYQSLTSNAEDI